MDSDTSYEKGASHQISCESTDVADVTDDHFESGSRAGQGKNSVTAFKGFPYAQTACHVRTAAGEELDENRVYTKSQDVMLGELSHYADSGVSAGSSVSPLSIARPVLWTI